ncbi:MAG: 16S rRNA (uracil(1498)-N(3))-methyltransferase [Xenococcaceae cyanobacterium MO_188.B29]|nr:16S rRNA (uracil(1498)-N(3))-methyltransferase [Xenococcaceae cyanobacterium MO_188.B29]
MVYRLVITPEQRQSGHITLTSAQQHYLKRVLRMQNGDRFVAMDGQGKSWLAEITGESAQIIETIDMATELPVSITLIAALPKGNNFEQVIRSCTELGVSTFMPTISDRTLLKPSPHKLERWRKIATEAAEQSERQFVPAILNPVSFTEAISTVSKSETARYICVARGNPLSLWSCLQDKYYPEIVIAIGCEGGWTEAEIEQAIDLDYQPVSLGRRILRAVTAPIVAVSLVVAAYEGRELF